MEKRIYYFLIAITFVIVIVTSLIMAVVFYDYYIQTLNEEITISSLLLIFLPAEVGILVLVIVFIYFFSSKLTSAILQPLHKATLQIEAILSGEQIKLEASYDELEPFMRTISSQKKEIERSITKLKEMEKYRREFTANISHELKTPLTSINGYAEMIAEGITQPEDIKRFAKIIQKEGTKLLQLIDSVITLSKVEEVQINGIKLSFEDLDLYGLAHSTCMRLEYVAKEKGVSINLKGDNPIIMGNAHMVEDLIFNLVDNAIKYNRMDGKIEINIRDTEKFGILTIKDTGKGISPEEQERIFERFYRVDKSRSKKITGSGIGLSIVKHIVELHDGKISLESRIDEGTQIKIYLPKKKPR